MRERHLRQIETLKAIARFLRENVFTNARVLHLKDELLALCARVLELAGENNKAKSKGRSLRRTPRITKATFREQQLLPLSRRGRKLARDFPELRPALKVPHKNASVAANADAADRMADALTPHLKFLIKGGYARNCLKALRRDARALREQAETVRASRGMLGQSNRKLTRELAGARDSISELDSLLRSLDNYSKYRIEWEICNRVKERMGRPSKRRLAARERSRARSKAREDRATPPA